MCVSCYTKMKVVRRAVECMDQFCFDHQGSCADLSQLTTLCQSVSMRPKSLRYQDPAEIKRMLEEKKLKSPEDAREFTKRILARRKELKHEWLTTILDRARHGDYHAISYLKRRKSMAPIVSRASASGLESRSGGGQGLLLAVVPILVGLSAEFPSPRATCSPFFREMLRSSVGGTWNSPETSSDFRQLMREQSAVVATTWPSLRRHCSECNE